MHKLSMFTVFIDLPNGFSLVRNYFSGAVILIDKHVKRVLRSLPFDSSFKQSGDWRKSKKLLLTERIIIPESENEEKTYRDFLDGMKKDPRHLTIYLATTMRCNLRCIYCYEKGVESHRMTDSVGNEFLSWLKKSISSGDKEFVVLTLYGGEPLTDFRRLGNLIPLISKMCEKFRVKLLLTLITNGVLLTQERIDFLLRFGLTEVQVTIDGPKDVHDSRRTGRVGQPTFAKIFSNLAHIIGKVERVVVRINFDLDTYLKMPELLELLAESGYRDKITLSFHKTTWDTIAAKEYGRTVDSTCQESIFESQDVCDAYIYLCRQAEERGFFIPDVIDMGPCITVEENSVVVDPTGRIYKCVEMIGRKGLEVGSLTAGCNDGRFFNYLKADYLDLCFENKCPLIPICAGGCRSRALISKGNEFSLDCQKHLLEKINNELIKLHFSKEINQAVH